MNTGAIDLDAYESELAQRVEAGDQHVIHYAVKLIRTCLLRENPIVPRENFIRCFEAMKVLELQGKASEECVPLDLYSSCIHVRYFQCDRIVGAAQRRGSYHRYLQCPAAP